MQEASKSADCFLSKEMLSDLKQSILDPKVSWPNKSQFSDIYDFIIQNLLYQYALKDPEARISEVTNIEDFVLVLRQMIDREYIIPPPLIGNWNNKITLWESQNKDIFQEFLNFIYDRLIKKWTKFNPVEAQKLLNPLKELIQSHEFDLRIFSLNYDLILESVFNKENEHLVEVGFSQKKWVGDFNDPENLAKLKLYKLHGSVDWYFDDKEEQVKKMDATDIGEVRPLIVFGSGPKIQSYDPFLLLLGAFSESLKSANLFIVIGYSFQDRYINNILIQNLNSDVNKKMLIVDPFVPKTKEVFIKKIEQFQKSKSMHEIVNWTKISPDKIELKKSECLDFFNEYLKENCEKLKELLTSVEVGESIF